MKLKLSKVRKTYLIRFWFRCVLFLGVIAIYIFDHKQFDVLKGWNFFKQFSILHIIWIIWVLDMLMQLIPLTKSIALGSRKHFKINFKATIEKFNFKDLKRFIIKSTKAAYKIFLIWIILIGGIGLIQYFNLIPHDFSFLISSAFYVADLFCVLFFCPFRAWFMKNKCCTTCRIFNWDHLMMFTPMLFMVGFYAWSLIFLAICVYGLWEIQIYLHPERFWERSNQNLQCATCTDHLCKRNCKEKHYSLEDAIEDVSTIAKKNKKA